MRSDPTRGIGFKEAEELFTHPHGFDRRSDAPEQFRAIGWVKGRIFTVIYEVRDDEEGEYWHLVTLWEATREERTLYEESQ